jgi:ABC-type Co2+ transport system permease subunit
MTLVLSVQALFGDGGVTVMGANILNMGVIGGFLGYYTFIALSRLSVKRSIAMFSCAWVSMLFPAIALAFELWLAGTFPLKEGVLLMGMFQGAAGIGEGMITVVVFNAIARARPDMIEEEAYRKVSTARIAIVGGIAFLGLALAAPFLASSNPDGLEQTASVLVKKEISNAITLLFSDYAINGMGKAGEVAAIFLGFAVILIIWICAYRILRIDKGR